MPTTRGWLVGLTGAGLCFAGLAFGTTHLTQVGFALALLVCLAALIVNLGRHELRTERAIVPTHATASRPIQVTLSLHNEGRGSAPLLLVEDRLPPGLSARSRFAVNGIEAKGRRDLTYTLTPNRRGRYEIGPASIAVVDPFGLAQVKSRAVGSSSLMVYPAIEKLALPRDLGERRSVTSAALRNPTGASGEDFYTLREYAQGDDLRKVHWPSTAKRGRFMIRQEETPWHTRATVVLDDRRSAHAASAGLASFERAVEIAASFVSLYHSSGYGFRLTAAYEQGPGSGRGAAHNQACLDLLATIRAHEGPTGADKLIARLLEIEARGVAEETLIVVAGRLPLEAAAALARCRRRFRQVVAVVLPPHRFGSAATKTRWEAESDVAEVAKLVRRSGVTCIVMGPGEPLAAAWGSLAGSKRGGDAAWVQKPELV